MGCYSTERGLKCAWIEIVGFSAAMFVCSNLTKMRLAGNPVGKKSQGVPRDSPDVIVKIQNTGIMFYLSRISVQLLNHCTKTTVRMGSWVSRSPQIGSNVRAIHVTAGKLDFKTKNFPQATQVVNVKFSYF